MQQYSSSLRVRTIAETLRDARRIAREVGIVRVTDTTRLDRVGLPVFASIRPSAVRGSLCVSAGKGLRREEAEIGAYMEGIELAFAEPGRAAVRVFDGTARTVLDGAHREDAIQELCPWGGKRIPPDAPIDCVEATDLRTGERVVVPADVVLYPAGTARAQHFGSDGNGISSGNTVDEATLHGLTEVIERDVTSFLNVKDTSLLVTGELPAEIAAIVRQLDAAGFDMWIRYLPNAFGLPVFMAVIHERGVVDGIHYGYGCHFAASIALVRAVTEAAQCRLSAIHGGRDDLFRTFEPRARMTIDDKVAYLDRHARAASSPARGTIDYASIPDHVVTDIQDGLALLLGKLAEQGLPWALRVVLCPEDLPVSVVRVLVPGLEMYAHGVQRIGRRLRAYMQAVSPSGMPETSPSERAR